MESGQGSNDERRHTFKNETRCSQFRNGSNPWMARYVYAFMFLLATLLAWTVRDYGRGALTEMERLKGCQGARDCLGTEGVLRVSFGCFTFYFVMFLSTMGTSKLQETRNSWHSGWWSAKIVLWIAFTVIPFVLPPTFIQLYGEIAHFGAGVFLLIQLISVISFITWLNDCFQSDKNAEKCHIQVMLIATIAYVVSIVGIIMMYIWYAPQPTCLLNIFFITWTLVLLQLMTSVSLHPKVNAGILTPGLMGLYVVFICWCAIRRHVHGSYYIMSLFYFKRNFNGLNKIHFLILWHGRVLGPGLVLPSDHPFVQDDLIVDQDSFTEPVREPASVKCIRNADEASNKTDWLTIISFVVAILAMVIATFSTGIDSKCFQFRKSEEAADENKVPYGYGFFHFVFATGAMYFAMLLIGWNTHHSMRKWTIDVGWTSTWVRIVNEWLAVCVYLWMLVAPIVWKHRHTTDST